MPPLYVLNPPVNPFWDFVAGLEDHPFFNGPPGQARSPHGPSLNPQAESAWASKRREQPQAESELSEKAKGKQASVEDPPEADISTVKPEENNDRELPFRGCGRRRFAREAAREAAREGNDDEAGRRCRRGRRERGWGAFGGPPPFHPFFGPPPNWHDQAAGPPHGPHHTHPHGPPPHHRGPHRRPSPRRPRSDFNIGEFLNKLGERLGVDLNSAAEGLGLTADRFTAGKTSGEVDFEPRCDIFENNELYTVHLSLPGAKKSDVGVDYDGEHSVLRVTGVVHRPDADEQMLSELVVDGRKRENGVFEKAIRLGTKRDPAMIDVAGISAKMTDGVLVVKVPKTQKQTEKREVPISTNSSDAEQADFEDDYSEKPVIFDADEHSRDLAYEEDKVPEKGEISLIDAEIGEKKESVTEEQSQEDKKVVKEPSPSTTLPEKTEQREQLPAYSAHEREEEDWENFSDASGEAEYVKIDVK